MAMSRNDKPSPHSSPRLSRRIGNIGQGNEIYASQQQQHQSNLSLNHSLHSINGNQQQSLQLQQQSLSNNNIHNHHVTPKPAIVAATAAASLVPKLPPGIIMPNASQTLLNRMSAPLMSTTSGGVVGASSATQAIGATASQQFLMNKMLNKTQSADINEMLHGQDPSAPPLPPRKASPCVDSSVNRLLKPHSNVTAASSLVNLSTNSNMSTSMSRSSENITFCDFEVPKTIAPPIPRHNNAITVSPRTSKTSLLLDAIDDDFRHHVTFGALDADCDKVIVGPAETITGLIDTRPIEARKPIVTIGHLTIDKDTINASNGTNNLYHLKMSNTQLPPQITTLQLQQQILQPQFSSQMRHQSYPGGNVTQSNSGSIAAPPKSMTTPHFGGENNARIAATASSSNRDQPLASVSSSSSSSSSSTSRSSNGPLLYENVTINTKDCNVPYENINLEYIARLMEEGYSKESVITALGISRNNIEMACDILHEFVSKNGA